MIMRAPIAYIAIAGFCILLHNVVMVGADSAGASLIVAILLSFTVVASAGYVLHGRYTFCRPLALRAFLRYAFAMSANIPLAFVTTAFWHNLVGFEMAIAAPLASLCLLALNFVLGRWAIAAPSDRMVEGR